MNKIIWIYFVFLMIYLCDATRHPPCKDAVRLNLMYLCGSDGYKYENPSVLECIQRTEYGKRVDLQLQHYYRCFIWSFPYIHIFFGELISKRFIFERFQFKFHLFLIFYFHRFSWFLLSSSVCATENVVLSEQPKRKTNQIL